MRKTPAVFNVLGAFLLSGAAVGAQAAQEPFYNPANAASPSGYTTGYTLFRTIGCPGRELLGKPCDVPPAAVVVVSEPAAEAAPEPAPLAATAEPAPEPAPAPAPAPQPEPEPQPAPALAPDSPPASPPASEAAPAAPLILEGVNFDFDKAVIRPEGYAILDQDVVILKEWGDVDIVVAGHADSTGTEEYNLGLSRRRAEAVRDYLISKGLSEERLTVEAYGESRPIATNSTREGRALNRRVELVRQD